MAERGYILATGKRPYVLLDLYGNANALPKLIDDKAVRTADIRVFLEEDFPVESLPTVEKAERLVADHRKVIERSVSEDRYADRLAELKHSQLERRVAVERERARLDGEQRDSRLEQQRAHKAERDDQRRGHRQEVKDVRAARDRNRPTGLAAFLGRITGVDLVRRAIHRHQDRQRHKAYREERGEVKARQERDARALEVRLKIQAQEVARKEAALAKVDKRELAAFMRDQRTDQRIRDRGGEDVMPSLEHLVAVEEAVEVRREVDLIAAFGKAKSKGPEGSSDLLGAFSRAAEDREESDGRDESESSSLDRARPPDWQPGGGPDSGRGRER